MCTKKCIQTFETTDNYSNCCGVTMYKDYARCPLCKENCITKDEE